MLGLFFLRVDQEGARKVACRRFHFRHRPSCRSRIAHRRPSYGRGTAFVAEWEQTVFEAYGTTLSNIHGRYTRLGIGLSPEVRIGELYERVDKSISAF